jgi:hypothetical protein
VERVPPAKQIRTQAGEPTSAHLAKAYSITIYAHTTARSLLDGFNSLGIERGSGSPSIEQQDLLRAMLIFAGAGLDACAQQVVRDALPRLVENHADAREALVNFGARVLRKSGDTGGGTVDTKVLASIMVGDPEANLIERLIDELTGSSMQSVEELKRVAAHLGVTSSTGLMSAIDKVKDPLDIRNRIAHDMDIKITEGKGRNRVSRKRASMVDGANLLLAAAEELIIAVDNELAS